MSHLSLAPAYDLDTGAEIVDDVTVDILVLGHRKVPSTTAERVAAVKRMIQAGHGVRVIANRIGISIDAAKQLITEAGYRIEPDPMYQRADGSDGNRNHIVRGCDAA